MQQHALPSLFDIKEDAYLLRSYRISASVPADTLARGPTTNDPEARSSTEHLGWLGLVARRMGIDEMNDACRKRTEVVLRGKDLAWKKNLHAKIAD
jgi:hypothetical protein